MYDHGSRVPLLVSWPARWKGGQRRTEACSLLDVVKGIAEGCKLSSCALIGGETAEMPGMYQDGDYDLAGFVVGRVDKKDYIDGTNVKPGMGIYALPSSGFHSNGYSLIRKLIQDAPKDLKEKCLIPTRIYVKDVKEILLKTKVFGMAHITGGGLNNIKRINPRLGYHLTELPTPPEFMTLVMQAAQSDDKSLYQTFNMGIGFVFILDENSKAEEIHPELVKIGTVTEDSDQVKVLNNII